MIIAMLIVQPVHNLTLGASVLQILQIYLLSGMEVEQNFCFLRGQWQVCHIM